MIPKLAIEQVWCWNNSVPQLTVANNLGGSSWTANLRPFLERQMLVLFNHLHVPLSSNLIILGELLQQKPWVPIVVVWFMPP